MDQLMRFALLGLGLGAMYALAAQGLVIIYRGSGVLNFAQGAVGVVGAYVTWQLQSDGIPFAAALACGLLTAAVIGAGTQLVIMRQLRQASSLARLVATLGVLILINAAVVLKWGTNLIVVQSALPQTVLHLWGTVVISADRLILLGIAIVLTVAAWALYGQTRFGIATTAVAENERAASAVGISPDAIATANWAIGSALAGLAAILVAPITGLEPGSMTNLVLAAMAAALVAGFRSFPATLIAALVIGIAQTELTLYWPSQPGAQSLVPLVIITGFIIVTGRGLPLRDHFLQRLPSVGDGRLHPFLSALGIAVMAVLIATTSANWVSAFTVLLSVAIVLLSVVVLTGYAGQLSLAQFAIAGVGALIAGRLVAAAHFSFLPALLIGVAGAVPVGVLIALPAARTRGVNLAVVTLAIGTVIEIMVFGNAAWTGGIFGTSVGVPEIFGWSLNPVTSPRSYAFFCLVCFVAAAFVVSNLRRSRSGRRLLAIRTNERAAAALGIRVAESKLYAFGVSAGLAALGGILIAFQGQTISYSQTFTNFTSVTDVGFAFLGGVGYVLGSVFGGSFAPGSVGTAVLNSLLASVANWLQLVGGVVLIIVVLSNQDGIARETLRQVAFVARRMRRLAWKSNGRTRALAVGGTGNAAVELPAARQDAAAQPARDIPAPGGRGAGIERVKVAPAVLEASDLTVSFGNIRAVAGLSLTISPGRVLGLIGPNGAGKTTAIDAITGFVRPATGSLTLNGESIDGWPVARRARHGISRSFQSLELFDDATVLDNMRVAADPRDYVSYLRDLVFPVSPALPGPVVAALAEFDLAELAYRRAEELSYGQRRLLAVARAVASSPSVLLLDEPAAGLSEQESGELARLVRQLADGWGMAVLLVDHDMGFVMSVCNEIVVMDFGSMIAAGSPEQVGADPAVVAAYLGEPASSADPNPAGADAEGGAARADGSSVQFRTRPASEAATRIRAGAGVNHQHIPAKQPEEESRWQ